MLHEKSKKKMAPVNSILSNHEQFKMAKENNSNEESAFTGLLCVGSQFNLAIPLQNWWLLASTVVQARQTALLGAA